MADKFLLPKNASRIIVLQRIELLNSFLIKIRKFLGRYLFTSFITKYFLNSNSVRHKYYNIMSKEFSTLEKFINSNDKNFLSIGGGIGGLESIINQRFQNKNFYFIERNYISKKVKYGWGGIINDESYNDLNLQKTFLTMNGMSEDQINIYDYDKDNLPKIQFDIIVSLLSLDYHYPFDIYIEYLRKVSKPETKIIFDTINSEYFKKIFKKVEIIKIDSETVHRSKRIVCREFFD